MEATMAKKATFRDAQTVARARAERRARQATPQTVTRPRTQTIDGYRIQPLLPIHCGLFGAVCEQAEFTVYDDQPCVEAMVRLGTIKGPYTLVLTIAQALEADIIERV